jgi:ribosome biogenesis GTPase A
MAIQWYPGHMTKARRVLGEMMPSQDVVIEVLDARMPAASANPVVAELRGNKPCVKVLSKSDLADPEVTEAWLAHFESDPTVLAIATSAHDRMETRARASPRCASASRSGSEAPTRPCAR